MMKLKYFALSMALSMAVVLTGCSADRDINDTASEQPSNSVSSDYGGRASAQVDDNARNSAYVGSVPNSAGINDDVRNSAGVGNDAAYGGGAGGTNDYNNDGRPDGSVGDVMDDIGEAADDLGNAARDQINNSGAMR